jgi:hypothetical protein
MLMLIGIAPAVNCDTANEELLARNVSSRLLLRQASTFEISTESERDGWLILIRQQQCRRACTKFVKNSTELVKGATKWLAGQRIGCERGAEG